MFDDEKEQKIAELFVCAIGAGCALIGLLANKELAAERESFVNNAWECGDAMAKKFIERAVKIGEKEEQVNGQ